MNYTKEELQEALARNPGLLIMNPELDGVSGIPRTDSHMDTGANQPATSKMRNQRTNGYQSKKEADFAEQLSIRQKAGEVWFWLEQVPFKLPGGAKHRVDFMVFYPVTVLQEINIPFYVGRAWELVEIKGRDLPMGKLKRKQTEQLYNVKITVI